jgi:hypothetical protein
MTRFFTLGLVAATLVLASCTTAPAGAGAVATSPPSPLTSSQASPGPVPGVIGPVCHVSSLAADFGFTGPGRAFVFSKPVDGKCNRGQAFVVVASRPQNPSAPFGPFTCESTCRALATPDVDADGHAELAVSIADGFFLYFDLFRVRAGTPPSIEPFAILRHGVRTRPLLGKYTVFALNGSTQSLGGVFCGPEAGVLDVWLAAETHEGAGPYGVEEQTYRVHGSSLVPRSHKHYLVPQGRSDLLPQQGGLAFGSTARLCGEPLHR